MMEQQVPSEQDLAKLYGWVSDIIRDEIHHNWLHGTAKPQRVNVHPPSEFGVTDAIILQADVHLQIFVKMHPLDPQRELQGYKILCKGPQEFVKHLVPPITSSLNSPQLLWLTPFVDATTLHELVYMPNSTNHYGKWLGELYNDFLHNMELLWTQTKSNASPNLKQIYVERIWNRMEKLNQGLHVDNFMNLKIKVNEREYGLFSDVMGRYIDQMDNLDLKCSCTTHGDEHARNIMVYKDTIYRKSSGWILVDYVNTKEETDWVFSIAKMLQSWRFYGVLELAKKDTELEHALGASMVLNGDLLTINYNREMLQNQVHPRCVDFEQKLLTFAQTIAQTFGEDEQKWRQRLNLALFSVIFASAPLHFGKADFAVPIMFGESLNYLND